MKSWKEKLSDVLFENDGKKRVINRNLVKRLTYSFGLLGILAILIGEPQRKIRRKSIFSDPLVSNQSSTNIIPQHKTAVPKSSGKVGPGKVSLLPGPSMIARPGANEILPGTVAKALLQTSATDGPVKATLIEDVVVDGEVKIPSGSVLIGLGESTESRVSVRFFKVVLKEREVLNIGAIALDSSDQLVGLQASRLSSESIRLGASIGLNFVGGVAEGMKEKTGSNGTSVDKNSPSNALLNGAAQASIEQAKYMMEEAKNQKISLVVESGTPFTVFFSGVN